MKKKKVRALILSCLLMLILVFAMAACDEIEPIDNNNVGNVIYSGERPDYDSLFDFKSGYTAYAPPEVSDINKLTIQSDKITFADGSSSKSITKGDPMPGITNKYDGADFIGWYDVNDTSTLWNQSQYELSDIASSGWDGKVVPAFTMPAKDITIAPFFAEKGKRPLVPGSSNMGNSTVTSYARTGTQFFETDIGTQIGAAFTYSGNNGGHFRMQTMCGVNNAFSLKAGDHTFHFWFTNMGTETITFSARQVNSGNGSSTGNNPDKSTESITLTAGQSKRASITINLTANNNALTFIDLGQDQTAAKLGVVMSMNP